MTTRWPGHFCLGARKTSDSTKLREPVSNDPVDRLMGTFSSRRATVGIGRFIRRARVAGSLKAVTLPDTSAILLHGWLSAANRD